MLYYFCQFWQNIVCFLKEVMVERGNGKDIQP
jgi:hypothetical protein